MILPLISGQANMANGKAVDLPAPVGASRMSCDCSLNAVRMSANTAWIGNVADEGCDEVNGIYFFIAIYDVFYTNTSQGYMH
ncbi:hypothetical protein GCM10009347_00750 [Shewanella algicola]|nr:hypothetical protein GCM10009347_00750 [Shewanella algicola]